MKAFDVEIKKSGMAGDPLPAGAYIARILKAEVVSGKTADGRPWESLLLSFDIADGEHKDHFKKDYVENTFDNKKWKGVFRLTIPDPKNEKYYDGQKRAFGHFLYCLQDSNPGYTWDWHEELLKGKFIGVLFRDREYDFNGHHGMTTECCTFLTCQDVKEGNFRMPKPKMLKKNIDIAVDDDPTGGFAEDDLPF